MLSTMAHFSLPYATWTSLEKRYASQSKNFILQSRNDLLNKKGEGDLMIILLIYVNDILIIGNNSSHMFELLGKLFSSKDLGPLHFFS